MVLCLFIYFLAVHFDWSIILIRKSFGASRHISGKLGVKLAIATEDGLPQLLLTHALWKYCLIWMKPGKLQKTTENYYHDVFKVAI